MSARVAWPSTGSSSSRIQGSPLSGSGSPLPTSLTSRVPTADGVGSSSPKIVTVSPSWSIVNLRMNDVNTIVAKTTTTVVTVWRFHFTTVVRSLQGHRLRAALDLRAAVLAQRVDRPAREVGLEVEPRDDLAVVVPAVVEQGQQAAEALDRQAVLADEVGRHLRADPRGRHRRGQLVVAD